MRKGKAVSLLLGMAALGAIISAVHGQTPPNYTGNIVWLEVWKSGNVAFTLTASGVPCSGQFILNKSDDGFKNQYAALIAAKLADRPVRVYAGACIAATGGGGNYIEVVYLYYD